MRWTGYMIVNLAGPHKIVKNKPLLNQGEVCLPLALDIPDVLFEPPTVPTVEITIDEGSIPVVRVISDSVDALQEAGVKVRLVNKFQE